MVNDGDGIYFSSIVNLLMPAGYLAGGFADVRLLAWKGNSSDYFSAPVTDKFLAWDGTNYVDATTFSFPNQVGVLPSAPPLNGMPAMQLGADKSSTTTVLASSLNPSIYGASVTLTATISTNAATGTVTFKDGTNTLGTGSLTNGVATFTTNGLAVGSHELAAQYGGDTSYEGSSNILFQTVNDKVIPTVTIWPTASTLTNGQTLASSTLTGGAATPEGSFSWTTNSIVPVLGITSQSVTFTPTDTATYATTNWTVSVTTVPGTLVWTGAGGNGLWRTAGNWAGGVAPVEGDKLVFPAGASNSTAVNDFTIGTRFDSIEIGNFGYAIRGFPIILQNGITATPPFGSAEVQMNVTFAGATTISTGPGALSLSGILSSTNSVTKAGTGRLTLTADNAATLTGDSTISEGQLVISHAKALGAATGTTTIGAGAQLAFDFGNVNTTVARALIVQGTTNGTGAITILSGVLTVTLSKPVTINANTWICPGSGARTLDFSGPITDAVPGGGTITLRGGGQVKFGSSSNVLGSTAFLAVGADTKLTVESQAQVGGASLLATNGGSFTLSGGITITNPVSLSGYGVSGSGAIQSNGGINRYAGTITLLADANIGVWANSLTISNIANSAYTLRKSGSSPLIITGTPAFAGGIAVFGGTLQVDGTLPGTGTASVSSGATISGAGSLGRVTVLSGGHFSPASGPGTLAVSGLILNSGALFDQQINGTTAGTQYDVTQVAGSPGTAALGNATLNVTLGYTPAAGDTYTIVSTTGAVTGTFKDPLGNVLTEGSSFLVSTQLFRINYTSTNVTLTAVLPTTTVLASGVNPSTYGGSVTLTSTVSPSAATGTVTFKDGTNTLGTGILSEGVAIFTTNSLVVGIHALTASYGGDNGYAGSISSPLTQTVDKAPATVSLGSLAQTYTGSGLNATATTTPAGMTVNFTYDGSAIAPTNAGSYTVVGTISDDNYYGSATNTMVINKASAIVTIGSLAQTYTNGPLPVTTSTTPANLPVGVTYNGGAPLPIDVGSYTVVGTINHSNYVGSATNTLVIAKATMLVIADYKSKVYGQTNPLFTASYSGILSNRAPGSLSKGGGTKVKFGVNPLPFTGTPLLTTTADAASSVGAYTITAALGSLESSNYSFSFTNGVLTIEQAVVTVAADNKSRAYGSTNPVFTASYTGWLNGDNEAVLSGTPSLTTAAGTNSAVGGYAISAAIGTLTATNYGFSFTNGTLTVDKAAMSITADATNRVYGGTNPVFTGTVVGVLNNDNITGLYTSGANSFSPVGTYDIVPSLSDPDSRLGNYTVTTNRALLTVTKAPLLVIADYKSRVYGHTNPVLTASLSGFVNNEGLRSLGNRGSGKTPLTPSPVTGTASLTTEADVTSPVGPYTITAALGTLSSVNYSFSFTNGVLTVEQAVVTVAANNSSRTYGSTNPVFTASYTGWLNSDNETVLGGAPSLTTLAVPSSTVGTYPITAAIGTLTATNYSFAFTNGTLTVNKAEMSITANATNRVYGDANPALTGTVTGVMNDDNITGSYTTVATVLSPAGTYDIVPSLIDPGSKLGNYSVTTNRALLTVTKAAVTAAADNKSRYYGRVNPDLTISYTGLKNGDTSSLFTTIPTCTTLAVQSSLVGSYTITAASGVSSNYTFSYTPGTLTVTKAPLLVVGDDATRYYGRTNPVFSAVVTGLTNSDNITVQFSCPATNDSPVGEYRITMRLQDPASRLGQYAVTLRSAILTVEPGPLVGLVSSESRPYAGTNAPFSVTYSGWQNGEGENLLEGTIEYACTNDVGEVVDSTTAVGSYPIRVITEQTATNYAVVYENGTLTVTPVALIVTGDD
ncbi:MAG: MBG domain-containing protein, partial [Verrucomicrobia bacterium]|nr:MBG domain-containing protein [Verrucomicrobiota bacterium]